MYKIKLKERSPKALRYMISLMIVVGLIMLITWFFKIKDPSWILISAVVCTEIDLDETKKIVAGRILATLLGVILASIILLILGPGYLTLILALMIVTFISYITIQLGNSWKLATGTAVIVLVASLEQNSIMFAEEIALKRATEVIVGSLIAGIVSFLLLILFKKIMLKTESDSK